MRDNIRDLPLANDKEDLAKLAGLSAAEQEKVVEDYRAGKISKVPKRPRIRQRDAEVVTPVSSNQPDQIHGKECDAGARVFTGPPSVLDGVVENGQADFVITAPPGVLNLDDVGALAHRKLRDGGVCLVVVNQQFIPTAMHHLSKFLDYRWEMAIGRFETPVTAMNISSDWSPVLVYVKLPFSAPPWTEPTSDCFYNQGPRALTDLITALVPPGATVLDPLAGEGDIVAACAQVGRKCIAAEEDEQKAARARNRCAELSTSETDEARMCSAGRVPAASAAGEKSIIAPEEGTPPDIGADGGESEEIPDSQIPGDESGPGSGEQD